MQRLDMDILFHITKRVPYKGNENDMGYLMQTVYQIGRSKKKTVRVHRLVWETFNGEIPIGKEIDHIDNDKKITNLIIFSFLIIVQIAKKQLNLALI